METTVYLSDDLKLLPRAVAYRAALVLFFRLGGIAADRANVKIARRGNPRVLLAADQQRNRLPIEPCVSFLFRAEYSVDVWSCGWWLVPAC